MSLTKFRLKLPKNYDIIFLVRENLILTIWKGREKSEGIYDNRRAIIYTHHRSMGNPIHQGPQYRVQ